MYGDAVGGEEGEGGLEAGSGDGDEDEDIEDAISAELGVIKTIKLTGLFKVIRLDVACGNGIRFLSLIKLTVDSAVYPG